MSYWSIDAEGPLEVTGSHKGYKSSNISEMVQDSDVLTADQ